MKTLHQLVKIAKNSNASTDKQFNFVINALFQIDCWKVKGLSNPYSF